MSNGGLNPDLNGVLNGAGVVLPLDALFLRNGVVKFEVTLGIIFMGEAASGCGWLAADTNPKEVFER